jgi:hypothetical protein
LRISGFYFGFEDLRILGFQDLLEFEDLRIYGRPFGSSLKSSNPEILKS